MKSTPNEMYMLGFCIGGNANLRIPVGGKANFSVFRHPHFAMGVQANVGPNASVFASQWSIGFKLGLSPSFCRGKT